MFVKKLHVRSNIQGTHNKDLRFAHQIYLHLHAQAQQEVQKEQHPTMSTPIRLIHSVPPCKTETDFQQEKAAEIRRLPQVSAILRQILGRVQMHLAGIRMNREAILIMRTHQILGEEATVKQAQTMDFSTTKRMMFSTLLLLRFQVCLHIFPPLACLTFSHTIVHSLSCCFQKCMYLHCVFRQQNLQSCLT